MPRVEQPFALDGYTLTDLIGFGATGEVWRGRDETTHEPVALKRLWEPAAGGLVLRLRQDAAVVAEAAGSHAVRVLEVATLPRGEVVLVMELAEGGSLASLLARRGRLHPSEVVTILGPLAEALAALHARGIVHGDLTPANVLFTADGRPMLGDIGLARLTGEAAADGVGFRDPALDATPSPTTMPPTAASDCFALAAIGYAALTGVPPRSASRPDVVEPIVGCAPWVPAPLASAIEAALAPDPATRPDVAGFGATVLSACGAAPVRLTGPRRTPEPQAGDPVPSRPRPRRLVVAGIVSLLLGVSVVAGIGSAQFHTPTAAALQPSAAAPPLAVSDKSSAPASAGAPTPVEWRSIVAGILTARARAFRAGDNRLLADAYWRHSPIGLGSDYQGLALLRRNGMRAAGFTETVVRVHVLWETPQTAQLRVEDQLSTYRIVDRTGRVVAVKPGRRQLYWLTVGVHGRRWLAQSVTVP